MWPGLRLSRTSTVVIGFSARVSLALFSVIGVVVLAIAACIGVAAPHLFRIPPDLVTEARLMFVLLGINIALDLPLGIYVNVLFGLATIPRHRQSG